MSNNVKILVRVRTEKVGSECREMVEFDRTDWEAMSPEEREDELREVVWNMAEWNWNEV